MTTPFSFKISEEDRKRIKMPPPLNINTFGRILLKQNFTDKEVINFKGDDGAKLLELIFNNEKSTDFFIRFQMSAIYFFISNPNNQNTYQKFNYLKSMKTNIFNSEEHKHRFMQSFEASQKIYHVLLRFVNKCRLRHSVLRIQTDLILNPISESHRNVITVYHCGNKYLFTVMDITKIIENSLLNSKSMVSSPIAIKNPYNNIPFSKSVLYNLYFQIKSKDFILSSAFHSYFLCNFNLKRFKLENEVMIRNEAIKSYLSSSSQTTILKEIKYMLKWYNGRCEKGFSININKEFPRDTLIRVLRPYLYHYLHHVYSLDVNAQYYNEYRLEDKLHEFIRLHPLFGCKLKKRVEGTNKWTTSFHDAAIPFKPDINIYKKYDTSHLEYETESESEEETREHYRPLDFLSVYANETTTNRLIHHDFTENVIVSELVTNLTQEQITTFNAERVRSPSDESGAVSSESNEVIIDGGREDGEESDGV